MSDPKSRHFEAMPGFLYFCDKLTVDLQNKTEPCVFMRRAAVLSVSNGLKVIDFDDESRWFVFSYGK